ncbi:MAG: hypothetical protein DRI88_04105 [Bacteroidetes bacterium]|nr:MAG: hypothetical protein DRI72_08465 [Bacteroidota bacterium]RLD48164.1 MAG: hypothetical protein DRI88_04105 [Bacteroidota bacterium]RLD70793.1 MAG: hypothetical protein DRI87_07810 [Bacteroidota bacterium]RLD87589.1 MAG: hypothetical protein DRJ02_05995 [Bacteroidota bacterium]HHL57928.1 hypothetical protein [Bacteroidota bacterium]
MKKRRFSKISAVWVRRIILLLLIGLLGYKLLAGTCNLWLCGLFVGTIVLYTLLSDYGKA